MIFRHGALNGLEAGASGDGGFSLVEVIVAMVVIAVGLLGLMAVQVRSLSTVALAKERQTATGLASRAMEQLRAVPYTVLQGGVVCSELAGDPDVAVTAPSGSCSATFSPSYDTSIAAESIVTTTAAQVAPLSPHQPADVAINAATYRVRDPGGPGPDRRQWLLAHSGGELDQWQQSQRAQSHRSPLTRLLANGMPVPDDAPVLGSVPAVPLFQRRLDPGRHLPGN